MAAGSDGSITIDTKLDNKGFDKGSQEMLSAIRSLSQEINRLGRTLQSTFSGYGKSAVAANDQMRQTESTIGRVSAKARSLGQSFAGAKSTIGTLSKDIGKLETTVSGMGSTAEKAAAGDEKALVSFGAKAASAESAAAKLEAQLEALGQTRFETEDYQWLQSELAKTEAQLAHLEDRQDKLSGTGVKESSQTWKNLQYDIDLAKTKIQDYQASMAILEQNGGAFQMGANTTQYAQMAAQLDQVKARLAEYQKQVRAAADAERGAAGGPLATALASLKESLNTALQPLRTFAAQVKQNKAALDSFSKTAAAGFWTAALGIAQSIQTAGNGIRSFLGRIREGISSLEQLGNEGQYVGKRVQEGMTSPLGQIGSRVSAVFRGLGMTIASGASSAVQAAANGFRNLPSTLSNIWMSAKSAAASGISSLGQTIVSGVQQIPSLLGAAVRQIPNIIKTGLAAIPVIVGNGLKAIPTVAKAAISTIPSIFSTVLNKAKSVASTAVSGIKRCFQGLKTVASTVGGGVKSLASKITSIGKSAQNSGNGFSSGLKSMLKYGLGIRSVFVLVNKLRSALVSGFQNLAQYSSGTNQSISMISSALTQLKNSFATAFAPILNTVAPILTTLINLLSSAISYVSAFFAALTGSSTYTKAVGVQTDYAASLNSTASAADSAAGSAKELKRQLAGFDDLNVLSDSSSSDSGSGGGGSGSGADASSMFEEASIATGVMDFVQSLKDAFEAGDYEEIGEIIGTKLNECLQKVKDFIDWETVGGTLTKYIDAVCGIFNGLVDGIDWDLLGSTFAAGIDTLLHCVDLLLTGIDWDNLGASISEGLNGLVRDIDWDLLGETIGDYFSAKLTLITSALSNFDWSTAGESLATGFNSLVTTLQNTIENTDWYGMSSDFTEGVNQLIGNVDWGTLGTTVGNSFNAVLQNFYGIVHNFNWTGLGQSVSQSINGLNNTIDWAALGKSISDSLKGALTTLTTAIENVNWYQLGQNVKTFITNIDWAGVADALFEGIGAAIGGLAEFLWGLIGEAWDNVVDYWTDAAFEDGSFTIEGLLNGILEGLSNIGSWIEEHIFQPFIDGFKSVFGIHSPSTVMAEQGGFLASGMLQGILDGIANIGQWIKDNILTPISKAFKKVGYTAEVGVSLLKDGWEDLKSFVGDKVEAAISLIKSGWSTISNFVGTAVSTAVSLIKSGWSTISSFVGTAVSTAISLTKSGWSTISKFVGTAVSTAISLTKSGWSTISSFVGTAVSTAISLTKSGWSSISSFVGTAVSAAISLTKSGWSTISKFVGTSVSTAISLFKSGWSSIGGFVGTAVSTYISLVKSGWSSIGGFVGTSVSAAVSLTKSGWTSIGKFVGTSVSVGISLVKSGWNTLKSFFGLSSGGTVAAKGAVKMYASGGRIAASGASDFWRNVPHYASGTSSAHGTAFVAGEAGPEVVGHIGGRTEVLNKSQLAATMYEAVTNGVGAIINAFSTARFNKLADCANGIISTLSYLSGVPVTIEASSIENSSLLTDLSELASRISYTAPVMSTGSVLPYSVAKSQSDADDITGAIEASNDDLKDVLVQAIASAAQLVASAVNNKNMSVNVDADSITQQTIDEINRRTLMFQASPLMEG
jgi:phage-related protein